MDTEAPRTLTIREAADYLGKTPKAIRSAVDRGSLPHVKGSDGVRRIPFSALESAPGPAPMRQGQPREAATEAPSLDQLVSRLEHLATENGKLKALTEVAESTEQRLRDELAEARARAMSLELQLAESEAASGSWFTRRKRRQAQAPSEGVRAA